MLSLHLLTTIVLCDFLFLIRKKYKVPEQSRAEQEKMGKAEQERGKDQ